MNFCKRSLFIIMTLISLTAKSSEEVLYWMVDETSIVHYNDGTSLGMPYLVPDESDITLAARIRVVGNNLDDTFLDIYVGDGERWSGDLGVDFSDPGSGYWGVGNPTGMQSPLSSFSSPEYSFMIEIGNYNWTDDSWTTVAHSGSASYNSLSSYIFNSFDISPPTTRIWNPTYYYGEIPEPNSGLLFLIGISMLLLIRNRTNSPID